VQAIWLGTNQIGLRRRPHLTKVEEELRGPHESDSYRSRVAHIAEEHRIASVDLTEAVRRADSGDWRVPVVPHDGHFNGKANREMPAEVARLLHKERLN
jgi:hypothetical protein